MKLRAPFSIEQESEEVIAEALSSLDHEPSSEEVSFVYDVLALQRALIIQGQDHIADAKEKIMERYGVSLEEIEALLQPVERFRYPYLKRLAHVAFSIQRSKFFRKLTRRSMPVDCVRDVLSSMEDASMVALCDLGAFSLEAFRKNTLSFLHVREQGIRDVVLMEDRNPLFFLNFHSFEGAKEVPLNRHGPCTDVWTQADLQRLVKAMQGAGLRVHIGFWCNYMVLHQHVRAKTRGYEDNPFIQKNSFVLEPVLQHCDDMNVYTNVETEEGTMSFATYIGKQYERLVHSFGFDGLFLGDGAMGLRNFLNLQASLDFRYVQKATYDFYKTIATAVHAKGGKLFAYDCNGYGFSEAARHGVNYASLFGDNPQKETYLDGLVVQYYPEAWGKYMKVPGRVTKEDTRQRVESILKHTHAHEGKIYLTLELGDTVEGWCASRGQIQAQWNYYKTLQEHFPVQFVGVWTNELLYSLLS